MNVFHQPKQHDIFIRVLLLLLLLLFIYLIQDYIISLVLAVVFAALLYPTYNWLLKKTKGRKSLSSIGTVLFFLSMIVVPTFFLIQQIISQAIMVSDIIIPFVQENLIDVDGNSLKHLPSWFPFKDNLEPYSSEILQKSSELVAKMSNFIVSSLTGLTQGTFIFFINFFVMLYAMYYFLIEGEAMLESLPNYIPFTKKEFKLIKDQVKSITKATLKGAFLIGIIQGILVGIGLAVAGIPGAIFWGSVAALLSLIPSVGSSLIYVPAAIYLFVTGNTLGGTLMLIWGFGVVSSVDNFLRPFLIGKDIQMPDILILISTLGGITFFGISGIILGPLIAGLFLTMLKIYKNSNLAN
ncbi:AI-2E family transporter [Flavobacterium sp.]|uniref:AI-2E family transporter n=1 Tax=Flavobacterium sp. TaxID=239 RepID=UPI003527BA79